MYILSLNDSGHGGSIINGIESATWVERYIAGGEFTFETTDVGLLGELPINTLVSHSNTQEIMIVETHEVEHDLEEGPKVKVTGRGLDQVMMENRIVTRNGGTVFTRGLGIGADGRGYTLGGGSNATYARILIEKFLENSVEHANYSLANFNVRSLPTGHSGQYETFVFKRLETLWEAVMTILTPDNIGIRVERPNNSHSTIDFVIHSGIDRSTTKQLSWFEGDIKKARYLWSSVNEKTAMFVYDQNVTTRMSGTKSGIHARVGKEDSSNLDLEFSFPLVNAELDAAYAKMQIRATQAIKAAKRAQLVDAEVADNPGLVYGEDYHMGDIVMVLGDYETHTRMRVTEHATVFDDQGVTAYPTLTAV